MEWNQISNIVCHRKSQFEGLEQFQGKMVSTDGKAVKKIVMNQFSGVTEL